MSANDPAAQQQRRQRLFALHRRAHADAFGPDGAWLRPDEREPGPRERFCHAMAFLAGNAAERGTGNALVRAARLRPCEFAPMHALELLLRCADTLEPETQGFLSGYVADRVDDSHDHIHSFWGMNWNQVCIGTFILLAAGERLGRQDLVQAGRDNLLQAREVLTTNGFTSEYCSGTYTPIALHALQEIVHLVRDPLAVDLAHQALARVWLELACFWHAPSRTLGGPMSRAYAPDSLGLPHHLHLLLWCAFGEPAVPDLAHYFYEGQDYRRLLRHFDKDGTPSFYQHAVVVTALPDYEIPDGIEDLLFRKTYPFAVQGSVELAEESFFAVERSADNLLFRRRLHAVNWPCQRATLRAWHTEDVALATSTGWWLDGGQSEQFMFCGRRTTAAPAADGGWLDRTTLFVRTMMNDRQMAGSHTYPGRGHKGEGKHTRQEGLACTAQHEDLVLFGSQPTRYDRTGITRIRLAVILPVSACGPPDEVWYGGQQLGALDAAFVDVRDVFLRWGRSYLALRPLIAADWGRTHAVTFGLEHGLGVISLINYEGEAQDFEEHRIVEAMNGFVARAGSEASLPFVDFRGTALAGHTIDQYYLFVRRLRHVEAGRQLALEYGPNNLRYKQVALNGRQETDTRFAATGVDPARFPFFDDELEIPDADAAAWFERIGARTAQTYRIV